MKSSAHSKNATESLSGAAQVLFGFGLVLIALHVWGAFDPSHDNWGVHQFGFYDGMTGVLALCAAMTLLIPRTQSLVLTGAEHLLRPIARLPAVVNACIVAAIALGAATAFPAKLHLLGDGAVLLRSINQTQWEGDLVSSFRNQPLMIWIFRSLKGFYTTGGSISPYDVYEGIDLIACVIFVGLVFWFIRSLQRPLIEQVLLGCLLFAGGGTQFFFGYVENYVLQYVLTALFAVTGWFALEKKVPVVIPIGLFALLAGLHLGNLIFFPGILVLIYDKLRGNRLRAVAAMTGLSAVILGFMFAVGFNLKDFLRHVTSGSVDFLQPFSASAGNFAYPMFSLAHFWDWLNAGLLIAPFGLAVALTLMIVHARELNRKDPALIFLLVSAGFGLLFTWIINSALGMARDWDLLASFFVPLMILDVYLLCRTPGLKPRRSVMALTAGLAMLHCAAWIGINASSERHLRRMKLLDSPRYMSLTTQIVYDEALANYFFDSGNYRDARVYYERYLKIDNRNPRILANIADVYRRVGEKDKYFEALKNAVASKSRDPGVYLNLGVEYAGRRDTASAIRFNEMAIAIDSTSRFAHANLGILYTNAHEYRLAEEHFSTAISLGLREPSIFRYAGDVCFFLGEYQKALGYYETYLVFVPSDEKVRQSRDMARERISPAG